MAPSILTYKQKQTVEEVAGQYGLTSAQKQSVVTLVNEQARNFSPDYFKAYDAAHSICAKLIHG